MQLPPKWAHLLQEETAKPYWSALCEKIRKEYESETVYPPEEHLFSAFDLTPPEQVRVVILGQDPYHEPEQAHGLAFSVREGVRIPPSLVNIYKELETDLGIAPKPHGCLTGWAEQGVLLLNTVLTVRKGQANSHKQYGWQTFTDAVISSLSALPQPIACVLWGSQAQKKEPLLHSSAPRLILSGPHPSPLSAYRGFFGSKPFSQINGFLQAHGKTPVDWSR